MTVVEVSEVDEFDGEEEPQEWCVPTAQARIIRPVRPQGGKRKRCGGEGGGGEGGGGEGGGGEDGGGEGGDGEGGGCEGEGGGGGGGEGGGGEGGGDSEGGGGEGGGEGIVQSQSCTDPSKT